MTLESNVLAPERTRTFQWQDPKTGADAARTMAGIDFLRTHGMNGAAPVASCLGFALVEAEPGRRGRATRRSRSR